MRKKQTFISVIKLTCKQDNSHLRHFVLTSVKDIQLDRHEDKSVIRHSTFAKNLIKLLNKSGN